VDAGLKDELVFGDPDAPRFVFWEGRLRPVPGGPAVRCSALTPAQRTRAAPRRAAPTAPPYRARAAQDLPVFDLMSIIGKIRAGLGAMGVRPAPPGPEESVEQFVRRNLVRAAGAAAPHARRLRRGALASRVLLPAALAATLPGR
jgi:oxygen-dependent protoporphyrinogen oxidase